MTKRKSAIAAAVKAAASGSSVFVFASNKEGLPADDAQLDKVIASTAMSEFGCTACGTSMHARAESSPFCITCGSGEEHVHVVEAKTKTQVTAKSALVALHCSTCDHKTTLQASVVKAITASGGHPVHCSCCGSEMHIEAGAVAADTQVIEPEWSQTDLNTPDVVDKSKTEASAEGEDDGDEEEDPKMKAGAAVAADADEVFDEDDLSLDSLESSTIMSPDTPEDVTGSDDLVLEPFSVEEDDLDDLDGPLMSMDEVAADADDMLVDDFGDEPEGDPLVDALSMDDTDVALAFVQAGARVVAMKGHVSVASFSKKSAGDNYRLMASTDALSVATRTAIKSMGLRKGLEAVGFSLVRVPASADATVARKSSELTASFNKQRSAEKKEFAATFALAAAGLNRGEFRGYENPLRAAMESELASLGLKTPRRVVSAIFANSGLQYAQTLLEVADRLSKMSASARKDLSEVLQMTNISAASEGSDDEDEDGDDVSASTNVEARLNTPALLRPKQVVSASALNDASAVLAGKASLTFASV